MAPSTRVTSVICRTGERAVQEGSVGACPGGTYGGAADERVVQINSEFGPAPRRSVSIPAGALNVLRYRRVRAVRKAWSGKLGVAKRQWLQMLFLLFSVGL